MNLNDYLRDVPDFPKPGIVFKDISPLLASPQAMQHCVDQMAEAVSGHDVLHDGIDGRRVEDVCFGCFCAELRREGLQTSGVTPGQDESVSLMSESVRQGRTDSSVRPEDEDGLCIVHVCATCDP